ITYLPSFRSRIILKQERRKQKEFFEKKKLRSKMKLLGVSSPPKSSAVSLDLLNLYVVNQISTKKDPADRVRKPVHVDMNRELKTPIRRHNIELPMSPQPTSSKTGLVDMQNRNCRVKSGRRVGELLGPSTRLQCKGIDHSSLEHQHYLAADSNSYPVSSSVSWSSDYKHSPEQNFRTNLACSPWELTYEEKQRKQPGNISQDPWVSNSPNKQSVFSKSNTEVPLGTLFKKLNSTGRANSLSSRPASSKSIKCAAQDKIAQISKYEPRHSLDVWVTQGRDVSPYQFLVFPNKETPKLLSWEYCDPFVNQCCISQLFTEPDDMNEISNRCSPYNRDDYNMTKGTDRCTIDRCLKGIFTGPEQTFFKSKTISSASHKENKQPNTKHLEEYPEGHYYIVSSESNENPSKYERTGKYQ
uniref:Uncharacterized protein n=1 Tax=Pelodiscus sinensis TaxID=13735 RepID=K7FWT1_PELSI